MNIQWSESFFIVSILHCALFLLIATFLLYLFTPLVGESQPKGDKRTNMKTQEALELLSGVYWQTSDHRQPNDRDRRVGTCIVDHWKFMLLSIWLLLAILLLLMSRHRLTIWISISCVVCRVLSYYWRPVVWVHQYYYYYYYYTDPPLAPLAPPVRRHNTFSVS